MKPADQATEDGVERTEGFQPRCEICLNSDPFFFYVSNKMWKRVVAGRHRVLCLSCFDATATRKRIDWTESPFRIVLSASVKMKDQIEDAACLFEKLRRSRS